MYATAGKAIFYISMSDKPLRCSLFLYEDHITSFEPRPESCESLVEKLSYSSLLSQILFYALNKDSKYSWKILPAAKAFQARRY